MPSSFLERAFHVLEWATVAAILVDVLIHLPLQCFGALEGPPAWGSTGVRGYSTGCGTTVAAVVPARWNC